ncbi:MAG: Abi family protein [Myxococcales bacterium]
MKYAKPALTIEQQVLQLLKRGMSGDEVLMRERLASVSYYRLSGYWFPFRQPDDTFRSGTTFEAVWERYVFDRTLRLIVMDAVERIEIAVRAKLSYHHAHAFGPFGYAQDPAALPKLNAAERGGFVDRIRDEVARCKKEQFVKHFATKYGDSHQDLPIWMATEVMSFGTVLSLYRASSRQIKGDVAAVFQVPDLVLDSWLLTLNTIRNVCAHHSRLWNREIGVVPKLPRAPQYADWHVPVSVAGSRVFTVLTICRHALRQIAPQSAWASRLSALLTQHPTIPAASMGFPDAWRECPIWK